MSLAQLGKDLVSASQTISDEKARPGVVAAAELIEALCLSHDKAIDALKAGSSKTPPEAAAASGMSDIAGKISDLKTLGAAGSFVDALQQLPEIFFWFGAKAPTTYVKDYREAADFKLTKLMQQSADNRPWAQAVQKIINGLAAVAKDNASGVAVGSGSSSSSSATASAATAAASSSSVGAVAAGFEKLPALTGADPSLAPLAKVVGELTALAKAQDAFLAKATTMAKPADISPLLADMSGLIGSISGECDANERHKTLSNHFQAIAQATSIFSWVCVEKPIGHCEDNIGIFEVFINKIFTTYKGQKDAEGEAQMVWARELRAAIANITATVKQTYRTGPNWGSAMGATAPAPAPAKKAGGPPPPPPPPPPPAAPKPSVASSSGGGGGDMSAMFAEISSKGTDISKMLKHVTDDQKAYKQANREVRTVSEDDLRRRKAARKGAATAKQWAPKTGTPTTRLEADKRYVIEFHGQGEEADRAIVEVPDAQMRHMVFISACNNAFIKIVGKVNSVQIIECLNVQVQISDTVGPVEVTGSERVEVLITGSCPSVIAGKVNGLAVHLAGSLTTEIVTSCTTGVNVTYPIVDEDGDKDTVEVAVPEQFMSKIGKNNKITTTVVTHGE